MQTLKPGDSQILLETLTAEKAELEALLSRDLKQELAHIDSLIEFVKAKNIKLQVNSAPVNGTAQHQWIYDGARTLADLAICLLRSVNGAWLSPAEMAEKLVEAGVARTTYGLSGHVSTALRRRMSSVSSPDRTIEFLDGRYRYKAPKLPHD